MVEQRMKKVFVLICNSNLFVPYVLSEVMNHRDKAFLIMSDIENMVRFFNEMSLPNMAVLRYSQSTSTTFLKIKRKLLAQTAPYDIQSICFFHAEYGGIINWFLQRKAKEGVEIFYCKVFSSMPYSRASGFLALRFRFLYRLLNGVDVDVLCGVNRFIPSLPQRFFDRVGAIPYEIKIDYDAISLLISQCFPDVGSDAKVVLLTGSNVAMNMVEEEEYTVKTNALINAIGKDKCIAKCHPRFNDLFGEESELRAIPSYIPGNLVIGKYDVFIGNHSTLLVEAAVAGKLAISLLDYYEQKDVAQKGTVKAFFQDRLGGRGIIHYPATIEEILTLIHNIK